MGSLGRVALSSSSEPSSPKSAVVVSSNSKLSTTSSSSGSSQSQPPSSSIRRITKRKNGMSRDVENKVKKILFGEGPTHGGRGKNKSREVLSQRNGVLKRNHERRAKTEAVKRLAEQKQNGDSGGDGDDTELDEEERGIGIRGLRPRYNNDSARPNANPSPVPFISTKIYVSKSLERAFLSLIAPLPNENGFGIKACLVMSMKMVDGIGVALDKDSFECLLQFRDYPKILDALLAHSGVFSECALRHVFVDVGKARKMNYNLIWAELLKRATQSVKRLQCDFYSRKPPVHEVLGIVYKKNVCCTPCVCAATEAEDHNDNDDEDEDYSLFQFHPELSKGIDSYFEIACILKGASFSESNARIMADDATLKRYILLAVHSSSAPLAQTATNILSNIAPYMKLLHPAIDPLTTILMNFVQDGLWSEDRFQVLYSLKILGSLVGQNDQNSLCWNSVAAKISQRFLELLLIDDLLLLTTTLLCIQEVARCVPGSCDLFAKCTGFIKTLVKLLSYDVHDKGPQVIIGMKIFRNVEIVDAPHTKQVLGTTPTQFGFTSGRSGAGSLKLKSHSVVSGPTIIYSDNVRLQHEEPDLYEIWKIGCPNLKGPTFNLSCGLRKTRISEALYSVHKKHIPIHLATLAQLPGPYEYERQAHYKRLTANDWIRLFVAHILKTLATNSWCALDLIRSSHYLTLVDFQYLALEAGADYYDALRELVEILESEDRGLYNLVHVE